MRLLHTSDWHLGRETYRLSRRQDHAAVIDEIVEIAQHQRPHLIVHSGDLFDGPRPGYEDLELGVESLQRLADVAPVVVVCGNHDSPALYRLFGRLLGTRSPIRFIDVAKRPDQGGILEFAGDRDERIRVAPLPFIHANRLVDGFDDPTLRTVHYADRVAGIERELARGLQAGYEPTRDILLFAAHLYVGGATVGRSERQLHVSDTYASRGEALPVVSYAALGHIHKPQELPGGIKARYAGSPLQLDFGEEGERKTAVLVDARPGTPAQVEVAELTRGRALRRLSGSVADVVAQADAVRGAIVAVTVQSHDPIPDLADQLAAALEGAVIVDVVEEIASRKLSVVTEAEATGAAELSLPELFRTYLQAAGARNARADDVLNLFGDLLEAVRHDEAEPQETDLPARTVTGDAAVAASPGRPMARSSSSRGASERGTAQ